MSDVLTIVKTYPNGPEGAKFIGKLDNDILLGARQIDVAGKNLNLIQLAASGQNDETVLRDAAPVDMMFTDVPMFTYSTPKSLWPAFTS